MRQKFLLIIISLYLIPVFSISAQSNAWVDMFSYLKVKHLQSTGQLVYAQSDNAFFTYNNDSGEIEKFSTVNGLSGDPISNFYYHKDLKKLFVFHKGGLIEIVDAQKNIFRSPELAYNTFIPSDKKILNNVLVAGNLLYLATKYGLTVYNLERNEFGDTYYFNDADVIDVSVSSQNIYVATSLGLYYAQLNDNLIDFNNWHQISTYIWKDLAIYNQELLGIRGKEIVKINGTNFQTLINFPEYIKYIRTNQLLSVVFEHHIKVFDSNLILLQDISDQLIQNENFLDIIDENDNMFIGTKKHGILKMVIGQSGYETLHPDSPLSNHAFSVDARDNIVWLAYGDYDASFNPYPRYKEGLSSYQDKAWVNIPYDDFQISDISFVPYTKLLNQA